MANTNTSAVTATTINYGEAFSSMIQEGDEISSFDAAMRVHRSILIAMEYRLYEAVLAGYVISSIEEAAALQRRILSEIQSRFEMLDGLEEAMEEAVVNSSFDFATHLRNLILIRGELEVAATMLFTIANRDSHPVVEQLRLLDDHIEPQLRFLARQAGFTRPAWWLHWSLSPEPVGTLPPEPVVPDELCFPYNSF